MRRKGPSGGSAAVVRRASAAGAVVALALTASCFFFGSHNIKITIEYEDLQRRPQYTVSTEILLGAELILVLWANSTTGFIWTHPAEVSDPAVMEQTDYEYRLPPNPRDGQSGHAVFTFTAKRRGACAIDVVYWRPFSGEVAYTCTVNVEVK